MAGTVDLDDVFRMLSECAHGFERRLADHYWRITFAGKVYPTLPTGAKSAKRKEVQIPKVAKMVRVLGIDRQCACQCLPALRQFLSDGPAEELRRNTDRSSIDEPD